MSQICGQITYLGGEQFSLAHRNYYVERDIVDHEDQRLRVMQSPKLVLLSQGRGRCIYPYLSSKQIIDLRAKVSVDLFPTPSPEPRTSARRSSVTHSSVRPRVSPTSRPRHGSFVRNRTLTVIGIHHEGKKPCVVSKHLTRMGERIGGKWKHQDREATLRGRHQLSKRYGRFSRYPFGSKIWGCHLRCRWSTGEWL